MSSRHGHQNERSPAHAQQALEWRLPMRQHFNLIGDTPAEGKKLAHEIV